MVEPNADCCGCWPSEVWPNVWPLDGCCVEDPKAEVEAEVEDEDGLLACVLWFKAV